MSFIIFHLACSALAVLASTGNVCYASLSEDLEPPKQPIRHISKIDDLCIITQNRSRIFHRQYMHEGEDSEVLPNSYQQEMKVSPPDYYKMLWFWDGGRNLSNPSLYRGNGILLRTINEVNFILVHRFHRNIRRSLFWASRTEAAKEVVRWNPPVEFDQTNGRMSKNEVYGRDMQLVFRFGSSSFFLYARPATKGSKELMVDESPDLPKRKCKALRYMGRKNSSGQVFKYEFKETPVAIQQRKNLESIRVVSVGKFDDAFTYYHIGMPIVCQNQVSYLIYGNTKELSFTTRLGAVSVYFLLHLLNKWAENSSYKTLEAFARVQRKRFSKEMDL